MFVCDCIEARVFRGGTRSVLRSPKDMSEFIRLGANECGSNQASGVWAAGYASGETAPPYTVYGLVNAANPGVLFI
jgi:hypothetical protein